MKFQVPSHRYRIEITVDLDLLILQDPDHLEQGVQDQLLELAVVARYILRELGLDG